MNELSIKKSSSEDIDVPYIIGKSLIFWADNQKKNKLCAIDTDQITPADDCISYDIDHISDPWKKGAFKYLMPDFSSRVAEGRNFLIVGERFGIGSSREMSPAAIKAIGDDYGLDMVIVCDKHVGSIFARNAVNLGLVVLESPDAVRDAAEGDMFCYAKNQHLLKNITAGKEYHPKPLDPLSRNTLMMGGLIAYGKHIVASNQIVKKFDTKYALFGGVTFSILKNHLIDAEQEIIPGVTVRIRPDLLPASDGTAPFAIYTFNEINRGNDLHPYGCSIINDHFVYTDNEKHELQLGISHDFAARHGIESPYYARKGSGIFHFYLPEQGLINPLGLYVGADSHSRTYGAYSALGFGVGSTDLGFAWATGFIDFVVPIFNKIVIKGELSPWVTGKDIVLYLISQWGQKYHGSCLDIDDVNQQLPIQYRHTIANMMAEAEVVSAVFKPDNITEAWIRNHSGLSDQLPIDFSKIDVSDEYYNNVDIINLSSISIRVARPYHPSNSIDIYELEKEKIHFSKAMIGSCTNGGYSDLYQAALICYLAMKQGFCSVNSCKLVIYPGSSVVRKQIQLPDARLAGASIEEVLTKVGACFRESWCGPCFGQGEDALNVGEVAITTFNRNWQNRMGRGGIGYLASPVIVAASAMAGYICSPDKLNIHWYEVKDIFF